MSKIIVHKNALTEYLYYEIEKLEKLNKYLEVKTSSIYIKKGYLYIPQEKYTQEHLEVVLNLLKQYTKGPECRRKDICRAVLEANV